MGVQFSIQSISWASETEEQNLPRATQTIVLCQISGDVTHLLSTLRDLNVFIHLKSDADKFKA